MGYIPVAQFLIIKPKTNSSAEGGIRTHESRGDTGLANLRLTRLGYLDFSICLDLWLFNSSVSFPAEKSCQRCESLSFYAFEKILAGNYPNQSTVLHHGKPSDIML